MHTSAVIGIFMVWIGLSVGIAYMVLRNFGAAIGTLVVSSVVGVCVTLAKLWAENRVLALPVQELPRLAQVVPAADLPSGPVYVGLENLGAAGYLNVILQSLFFTGQLRKAIYQSSTDHLGAGGLIFALQSVFYQLQTRQRQNHPPPVSLKPWTTALGWSPEHLGVPKDVTAVLHKFLNDLKHHMIGTPAEGSISALYEGTIEFHYESSLRTESFYCINLHPTEYGNIYEELKHHVQVGSLEQYNTGPKAWMGVQEVVRCIRYKALPPVLHFALRRFRYDEVPYRKSDARFQFGDRIHLDEFVDSPGPWSYSLLAVIVHTGTVDSGSLDVFINPTATPAGPWYDFADASVRRCGSTTEAIQGNFGEGRGHAWSRNAYILIYVRDSVKEAVLQTVLDEDIPKDTLKKLQEQGLILGEKAIAGDKEIAS